MPAKSGSNAVSLPPMQARSWTGPASPPSSKAGVVQAASWTLREAVAFDRDGITSRDWDSYPILGFDNVPAFETVLIDPGRAPFLGAGEATTGPTAAAIANAVYAATGLRLRRVPFTPDAVRAAALG